MNRRVLLVNPAKQDNFSVDRIHMGLTLLGEILVSCGYQARIMDYAFLRCLKGKADVPNIEDVIDEFLPDVIGLSVFTYVYDETQILIDRIARHCDAPIILGGPHMTIFPDDFRNDGRVSYLVRGEAETVIPHLVRTARRQTRPIPVDCPPPQPREIPAVNLDIAYGSEYLKVYQMQLSRGCPYGCSFCNVRFIAGPRVRARDLDTCLAQVVEAKRRYPSIGTIAITDDCPTFDRDRFKSFLRILKKADLGCILSVDNMRANLIDEEMLELYRSAGGRNICLGVESGHPEVFRGIRKGESLEEIIEAARLVRRYGLSLGLCFVIGLPGDDLERHQSSVGLARMLRPDYVFWNMCIPWPGTPVCRWYQSHGEIGDPRNFSTLIDPQVHFREPVCSCPGFPKKDMIRAWLSANIATFYFSPFSFRRLVPRMRNNRIDVSIAGYTAGYFSRVFSKGYISLRRNLKQFGLRFVFARMFWKIRNALVI